MLFALALFIWVSMYLARKCWLGTLYFTSPNGDGTAILRGHPSHAKVSPLAVQSKYLHFSVILRPWVLVRPRESNPRPPALQSNALPTELILPRLIFIVITKFVWKKEKLTEILKNNNDLLLTQFVYKYSSHSFLDIFFLAG